MKRSEMIQIMRDHYTWALDSDYREYKNDPMAYVLQVIEEEGMMPPVNEKMKLSTILAGEAYEWEPEDGD